MSNEQWNWKCHNIDTWKIFTEYKYPMISILLLTLKLNSASADQLIYLLSSYSGYAAFFFFQ